MKNRLISLLLCCIMVLSVFPGTVSANEAIDYSEDINFINSLGIYEIDAARMNDTITRRMAVLLSMKLYLKTYVVFEYNNEFSDIPSDDPDAGKLALAVKNGIIAKESSGKFIPDGKVSYIEAVKMIFNSLNYGAYIKSTGMGDSKYGVLASANDLVVDAKNPKALTVGEMAQLVRRALDVPLMKEVSITNGKLSYKADEGVTALTEHYGIYSLEGIVTANGYTSLYTKDKAGSKNGICINNITLSCREGVDTNYLLGRYIKAYYSDEDKEMLYHEENSNQSVVLMSSDDIQDFKNDTYYHEEGSKVKSYRVHPNAAYIYNGVAITGDDGGFIAANRETVFEPENGFVELISNNSGVYEIVKITNYETFIADGIDYTGLRIVDKYGDRIAFSDADILNIRDTNGESIGFDYISRQNVLSVASSIDKSIVDIIVTADAVEGSLNSNDGERIGIEGEYFTISDILNTRLSNHTVSFPPLGEYVILYLDALGKVCDIAVSPNNGWKYGYLIKLGSVEDTSGMSPKLQLKMLTEESKVEVFDTIKKLNIDGAVQTSFAASHSRLIDNEAQPVKYRVNVKGEIKDIDTIDELPGEDKTSLKRSHGHEASNPDAGIAANTYKQRRGSWADYASAISMMFRSLKADNGVREDDNWETWYIKPGATIFTVPTDPGVTDPRRYSAGKVENVLNNDSQYSNIYTYIEDRDELVDTLMVRKTSAGTSVGTELYIVEKVTRALNADGENVWKLYLMYGGVIKEYTVSDNSVYDGSQPLSCGDIIRISADSDRKIVAMQKTLDRETDESFTIGGSQYNPYAGENGVNSNLYLIKGQTLLMKNNVFRLRYKAHGESNWREDIFYMGGRVVVVDKDKVYVGSASDITFDPSGEYSSDVVIDIRYLRIRNIIVYKN